MAVPLGRLPGINAGMSLPARLPVFTCPKCNQSSTNPNDVREGYCGACHWWTGHPELAAEQPNPPASWHGPSPRDDAQVLAEALRARIMEVDWMPPGTVMLVGSSTGPVAGHVTVEAVLVRDGDVHGPVRVLLDNRHTMSFARPDDQT